MNGWRWNAICIYVTHDKYVQRGDNIVDVSKCRVQEMYVKGENRWRPPHKPLTVREVIDFVKED